MRKVVFWVETLSNLLWIGDPQNFYDKKTPVSFLSFLNKNRKNVKEGVSAADNNLCLEFLNTNQKIPVVVEFDTKNRVSRIIIDFEN